MPKEAGFGPYIYFKKSEICANGNHWNNQNFSNFVEFCRISLARQKIKKVEFANFHFSAAKESQKVSNLHRNNLMESFRLSVRFDEFCLKNGPFAWISCQKEIKPFNLSCLTSIAFSVGIYQSMREIFRIPHG